MAGLTILCPFCFNKFFTHKMMHMCTAKSVCEKANRMEPFLGKGDRNGVSICPDCGRTTATKVCPVCHHSLPKDILDNETKIISIIGGAGAGKSYYVATMLRLIMEKAYLADYNNISVKWVVESREEYERRFKADLDNQRILRPTERKMNLVEDNPPLLLEISQRRKGFGGNYLVTNTFSFFDAAGESFQSESDLQAITPYLKHSGAVIIILDPRQVEYLDKKISDKFPDLPRPSDRRYSDILQNTIDLLRRELRIPKKQLKIPLCVAFSKWDLIVNTPDLLPVGLSISEIKSERGLFDVGVVNNMSQELRSLLMIWDAELVNTAENNFSDVTYFAFSAWGTSNTGGKAAPPIASYRVEDPLLWILRKEKII